jgi:hypothetical protein
MRDVSLLNALDRFDLLSWLKPEKVESSAVRSHGDGSTSRPR